MAGLNEHVVNIILQAKDNTSAAIAQAASNIAALNAVIDENQRKHDQAAEAFENSVKRQNTSSRELLALQTKILGAERDAQLVRQEGAEKANKAMADAVRAQDALRAATRARVDAESKGELELAQAMQRQIAAQRKYAELRQEATSKDSARHARRIIQLEEERQHELNLAKSAEARIKKQIADQERAFKAREAQIREEARTIKAFEQELEREAKAHNKKIDAFENELAESRRRRRNIEKQNAKEDERALRDVAKLSAELEQKRGDVVTARIKRIEKEEEEARAKRRKREELDFQNEIKRAEELAARKRQIHEKNISDGKSEQAALRQLASDQEQQYKRISTAISQLSKQKITPEDFDKWRKEIVQSREELSRLGVSGQESMRKIKSELDAQNVSISNQARQILVRNKNEEAHLAAVKETSSLQDQLNRKVKDYAQNVERVARLQKQLGEARAAGVDHDGIAALAHEFDFAKGKALELNAEIKAMSAQQVNIGVDLDTGHMIVGALSVEAAKKMLEHPVHIDVDMDIAEFLMKAKAIESAKRGMGEEPPSGLRGWLRGIADQLEHSSNRISTFDNFIRGLTTLGIAVFFDQIVVGAGAAAGALTALAGSAIYAAGAIGGSLVAGLAQAAPMLAVFGSAVMRVTAILKAANQAQMVQQQMFAKRNKLAKADADATDAITNAQEALAAAHRRVQDAQDKLTETRLKAKNGLQDLILAERDAALAARGAVLSQAEAQEALRKALSSGDTGSINRAQLAVDQADLGVATSKRKAAGASSDLATRRKTGVEGTPEVVAAKRDLLDATVAADKAGKSLEKARRSAEVAGAAGLAAAGNLEFMLSLMSDSEKKLYEATVKFQDVFRKASQNFTEPMIQSFTRATKKVTSLLGDPTIIGSLRKLSKSMSGVFDDLFDKVSSPGAIKNWKFFSDEAGKNVKIVGKAVGDLGSGLTNMAKAAAPALTEMLKYLASLAKRFSDFAKSADGQKGMANFFNEGVKHFKRWMSFLGAVAKLLYTIINPQQGGGATAGLSMLESLTKAINDLQESAASPKGREWLRKFFETSKEVMGALKPVIVSVAKAFSSLFDEQGVKNFKGTASIISNVLIPAFTSFMHVIGQLSVVFGKIADNPFGKWLGTILVSGALIGGIFTKILGALRPFYVVFSSVAKLLPGSATLFARLAEAMKVLGMFAGRLALLGGAVGIIVLLLQKLGLLDDAFRAISGAFKSAWEQIKPSLVNLQKAFKGLVDSLGGGKGISSVLKPVFKLLIDIAGAFLKVFGGVVGKMIANSINGLIGVVKILAGIIEIVRGVIKVFKDGDWSLLGKGLKDLASGIFKVFYSLFLALPVLVLKLGLKVGKAIGNGVWEGLKGLGHLIVKAFTSAWNALLEFLGIKSPSRKAGEMGKAIVNGLINGLKGLTSLFLSPFKNIWNLLKGVFSFDKLKKLGKTIIDGIVEGIKSAPGALKDAVTGLIKKIPGAGTVLKGLDKVTPWKGALPFAEGGAVQGPGTGTSDSIFARLSNGEHVWTAAEVAAAGGHRAMYALRAIFGGGTQGGPGGYMYGGEVRGRASGPQGVSSSSTTVRVNADADSDGQARRWRLMWQEMLSSTKRNANLIQERIRDMRVAVTATFKKLREDATEQIVGVEMSGKVHFERLGNFVKDTINQMAKAVFVGFSYIGKATNAVLKDFDSEPVNFSISPPSGGRAATGYIGYQGERGGDAIPIMVGRGEAVLNWAHQRMIEPALQAFYGMGLGDLFSRTSAYHAGGPQHMGMPGFAQGGYTGPFGSGAAFNAVSNFAQRKFGLTMTSGKDNHGLTTSSGNISDHSWGGAGDFSNGSAPTPQMDAFNAFWKGKAPEVVKQLIWRNKDQFTGAPIGGHMDHVHLALLRQYAFDAKKMARIISRKSRGLSIADLLAGNVDSENVEHINQPKLKGPKGPLRTIIFKAISKIRKAANAKLDTAFGEPAAGGDGPNDFSTANAAQARKWIAAGLRLAGIPASPANVELMLRRAMQESSLNPNVVNNWDSNARAGTPSKGLFQTIDPTFNAYKVKGHNNVFNPVDNTAAAARYMMARYGHLVDANGQGYARGGFIGGMPRFARGGFIGRAAGGLYNDAASSSRMRLIRRTGLYRPGALDPAEADYTRQVSEYEIAYTQLSKLATEGIGKLKRKAKETAEKFKARVEKAHKANDDKIAANLEAMTKEGGLLDQIGVGIQKYIERAARNLKKSQLMGTGKDGARNLRSIISGNDVKQLKTPDDVLAEEEKTLRGTLRRYANLQDRIKDSIKSTDKKLSNINKEIAKLDARADKIRDTPAEKRSDEQKKELKEINADIKSKSGTRNKLISNKRNLQKRIEESQDAINEALAQLWQAQVDAAAKDLENALAAIRVDGRSEKQMDAAAALANTFGDTGAIDKLAADRIELLKQQQGAYANALLKAQQMGDSETAKKLQESVDSTAIAINQAAAELFVKTLDDSISKMADAVKDDQLNQRVAASQGDTAGALGFEAKAITDMQGQAAAALKAAGEARAAGHDDLAKKYEDQYKEIFATINEAISAQFQSRIDAVNKAAEQALAISDRQMGLADTVDRLGGDGSLLAKIGAATGLNLSLGNAGAMRQSALEASGTAYATQRIGLQSLLQEATNPETIQALTDQLADLDKTIAENIVAQHENTIAMRQSAINEITARKQFQGGVFGGLLGLVQAASGNSGVVDENSQRELLTAQRNTTSQALSGLQDQLFADFGIDTRGTTGAGLANILKNINFDSIEATMSQPMKEQFEGLIDSVIGLGTELEGNTAALEQLNGTMAPQSFSSTAWNWFSKAIFDGMGNTLPQYTVPSFDTGGSVLRGGLAKLHSGEYVTNPAIKGQHPGNGGGDWGVKLEINEAGKVPDPNWIAERVAYEYRNSRGSR